MGIQNVVMTEWVLRLTPLLNGKSPAVCTDLGTITECDEVKKAILSHYNVNQERCRKKFRAQVWTKNRTKQVHSQTNEANETMAITRGRIRADDGQDCCRTISQ